MKRITYLSSCIYSAHRIMVVVAIYVPNTLPVGSDFSAIYYADLALVNGVHVYDIPSMEALARSTIDPPNDRFFMPRFPYPPWYVISTFYLGLMSIRSAGALWFEINLVMLFLSVWFLTDGWNGRLRLIAFPLSLFFLPVLGALSVGQYGFPVLLGTSLLIYSLRKENVALTILGAVHAHIQTAYWRADSIVSVGVVDRKPKRACPEFDRRVRTKSDAFHRRCGSWSFRRQPDRRSIVVYQLSKNAVGLSRRRECDQSVPSVQVSRCGLSRWLFDGSLKQAAIIAIILFIILMVLFWLIRKSLLRSPELVGYILIARYFAGQPISL